MDNELITSLSIKVSRGFDLNRGVASDYAAMAKNLKIAFGFEGDGIIKELNNVENQPGINSRMEKAIQDALSVTCVITQNEGPVSIFSGNVSAVLLDSTGHSVWSMNNLDPNVKSEYGDDLRPYAWKKALAAMVLYKQFDGSTLDNADDYEMLKHFGFKAHKGGLRITIGDDEYFLGLSGVLPDRKYAVSVGMLNNDDPKDTNMKLQGAFDQEFGDLVQFYINNPLLSTNERPIIKRPLIPVSDLSNQ